MIDTVLGIDIGTAITGWAVLSKTKSSIQVLDYGIIKTSHQSPMSKRLQEIYESIVLIIKKFKPNCMAIEDLFFFKNQKTVIKVGQARGVAILAGVLNQLDIFDYTPLQVKQAVTGYGKATKDQVQLMVKAILKLSTIPKPDDAADALGIAICHFNSANKNR